MLQPVLPLALAAALATGIASPQDRAHRDDPGRERARILRLADGRHVRGRAHLEGEEWVVEGAGRVPESSVVAVRPESEVLREAHRLERRLAPGDVGRRVELAAWMLDEGLVPEALAHLDRALEREPDHARALELVASAPPLRLAGAPPRGAPLDAAARASLRALGSRARPAIRELVVARLAQADPEALLSELEADLNDPAAGRRVFATVALRRLFPGKDAPGLVARSIFDREEDVRHGAALGLLRLESPPIDAHLRALESDVAAVRANAIESLGWLGQPAAVPALVSHLAALQSGPPPRPPRANLFIGREIAYVMDYDVEIAQGASIADPVIGSVLEGSVLDASAYGATIQRTVVLEIAAVETALERLTGENPGRHASSWIDWYERNRERWEAPGRASAPR